MAPQSRRRSRSIESDGEDLSRPSTPASTAPNDGKRARRSSKQDRTASDAFHEETSSDGQPANRSETLSIGGSVNGETSHPPPRRRKPHHQPGAIVRVKLTNFVTYSSAEFFPGPNLNMVIGPNGTGKSTLVCAICLGLGWGPQYLGRAKDAAEFVKHGSREATIEIELQRATQGNHASKSNPVITRTIKREGNKSTFTLDGAQSSARHIMKLAQSFDIQIDNLCQFLPQDKVVQFAQMTPIEILESTQRAAAPPEMLENHSALITLRTEQRTHGIENKGTREQLANLENRQDMQRTEVERLRERATTQKQLGWLEKCRPLARYADAKKRLNKAKAEKQQLQVELNRLREESGPALQKVDSKEDYQERVKILKTGLSQKLKTAAGECARFEREIKNLQEAMQECHDMQEAEKKSETTNRQELRRERTKLDTLKRQKEQPAPEFNSRAINDELDDLKGQTRVLAAKINEDSERLRTLREQGQSRRLKRDEVLDKIERLQTQSGQQESKLGELSQDTLAAWEWIKDNQDKFQEQVYGPPIVECSVKEPARARQIEALFRPPDLKFITVQNKQDFDLLQHEINYKRRIKDFSLRMCSQKSLDHFRPPLAPEQMEQFGLTGWALDYMEGPIPVLAMLCLQMSLHESAIARAELSAEEMKALETSSVKQCISSNSRYVFTRRAEYGAAGISSERREIQGRAKYWAGQSTSQGRSEELTAQCREYEEEMRELGKEIKQIVVTRGEAQAETKDLEAQIGDIVAKKNQHQQDMVAYRGLDIKISQVQDKIATTEQRLSTTKDRVAEHKARKDEAMFKKAEQTLLYAKGVSDLRAKHEDLLKVEIMLIEASNDYETLKARNQHILDMIKQKESELADATTDFNEARTAAKAVVLAVKALQHEGEELKENDGDSGLNDLVHEITSHNDFTEEDLDGRIDVEKAKLDLTEGGDDNLIKEFEDRARKIHRLQVKVAEFTSQRQELTDAINEVRSLWEPALDELVAKISDAFGDSFARIGCAGQVAVYKASSEDPLDCSEETGGVNNGLDFENWAIHISVKFRENEPLSLLDSHRQSGGERAVSTIFYLMALQSLSRAPFRVVDEINQGMDPRNERMVHGRMVDIAAADEHGDQNGSQYFLITPKLLSGLKYKAGMTVLCIVSGENMPNPIDSRTRGEDGGWHMEPGRKIDFGAFASKARTLGLDRLGAARSPVTRVSA